MTDWLRIQYNAIALYKNQPKMLKTIISCEWSLLDIYGCFSLALTTVRDQTPVSL
jgi:hypothetical protein